MRTPREIGTGPYGFDLAAVAKTLTENPAELEIGEDIRGVRFEGMTL